MYYVSDKLVCRWRAFYLQGWLELASARHSMGASRVNGALLDLKLHSAATSLQVIQNDGKFISSFELL